MVVREHDPCLLPFPTPLPVYMHDCVEIVAVSLTLVSIKLAV